MSLIKLYILFSIVIIAFIICLHTAPFFGKNYSGDLIKLVFEYITRYKIISIILIIFIIVIIFCIYDKNHTVHVYIHPDQQKIYDITQEHGKKTENGYFNEFAIKKWHKNGYIFFNECSKVRQKDYIH